MIIIEDADGNNLVPGVELYNQSYPDEQAIVTSVTTFDLSKARDVQDFESLIRDSSSASTSNIDYWYKPVQPQPQSRGRKTIGSKNKENLNIEIIPLNQRSEGGKEKRYAHVS